MLYISNVLRCFPIRISKEIEDLFITQNVNVNMLEEIRIRTNCPIILKVGNNEKQIEHKVTRRRNIRDTSAYL